MKTILLKYGYNILHFLWSRRENLYSLYIEAKKNKSIKIDWKVNLEEILEYTKLLKTSWLIHSDKDEELVPLWWLEFDKKNKYKKLVQYQQTSWACVIYSVCRAFTYNTWIELTRDEIEGVKLYAEEKGWWADKKGMSFRNGCRALAGWLKLNKWISITYDRIIYWSKDYFSRMKNDYMWVLWGYMTRKYITDFSLDWVVNSNYNWKEKKIYWHCITEKDYWLFVDNYPNRFKNNIYTNQKWNDFIKNWYMFWAVYFIWLEKEIIIKSEVIKKSVEKNSRKSNYDIFLDRGYINNPNSTRVLDEKLFWTLMERILKKNNLK